MPALPIIPNCFRVALRWSDSGGRYAVNVIHIRKAAATPQDVFDDIDATVNSDMWVPVSNAFTIRTVEITPLDGTSATEEFVTTAGAKWSGASAGDWSPASSAIVTLRTATRGRSARGRVYLPYVAESSMVNGTLTGAVEVSVSGGWTTFVAGLIVAGSNLVVASYTDVADRFVVTATCQDALATQRRRQDRIRTS